MKIGIIGAGMIGETLGRLWAKAGHEVKWSSRHPDQLVPLVEDVGANSSAGTVEEAAEFGEVILLAIPMIGVHQLSETIGDAVAGKVVLDANNPIESREPGVVAEIEEMGEGSGAYTASKLPDARVVKAFNTVYFKVMKTQCDLPDGEKVGVPLATDDAEAMEVAAQLVRDAGMTPVEVGALAEAKRFEPGTPLWNSSATAREVRQQLGVAGN